MYGVHELFERAGASLFFLFFTVGRRGRATVGRYGRRADRLCMMGETAVLLQVVVVDEEHFVCGRGVVGARLALTRRHVGYVFEVRVGQFGAGRRRAAD